MVLVWKWAWFCKVLVWRVGGCLQGSGVKSRRAWENKQPEGSNRCGCESGAGRGWHSLLDGSNLGVSMIWCKKKAGLLAQPAWQPWRKEVGVRSRCKKFRCVGALREGQPWRQEVGARSRCKKYRCVGAQPEWQPWRQEVGARSRCKKYRCVGAQPKWQPWRQEVGVRSRCKKYRCVGHCVRGRNIDVWWHCVRGRNIDVWGHCVRGSV